jgi:hypothetical protein
MPTITPKTGPSKTMARTWRTSSICSESDLQRKLICVPKMICGETSPQFVSPSESAAGANHDYDRAPSDVVDGAAEADPHREPVAVVSKILIDRQGKMQHCRESSKISVVNG